MLHDAPESHLTRFGVFELNTRTGELRKSGVRIRLRDQSIRILEMLLRRPGELVTREDIKTELWANDTFVEFDHSINAAVTRLRQALGDSAETPRYIETVAGRGYRYVGPVDLAPNAASGGHNRRGWPRPATAVWITLLIAAILATWLWRGGSAGSNPGIDSRRVVVAIFENRTDDPKLESLGRIATDWISDGLLQIGTIAVAPSSIVLGLATAGAQGTMPPDALATATKASLVVSGAYYKQGGTLQIHARITDTAAGRLLYAVEPATGPLDQPMEALATVRRRVVNAIAARYLNQQFDFLSHESAPPAFEAYREFLTALDIFYADNSAAVPHLTRAMELDPEFAAPRIWLIGAHSNLGNYAEAALHLRVLEGRLGRLTPINRHRLDFFRANLAGRYEEALLAQREVVKLAPGSPVERFVQAGWAISSNHLQEAMGALRAPVRWDLMVKPDAPFGSLYFLLVTGALHELGEHREELTEARRGRALYPNLLNLCGFELGALIALGRFDEMERLIEQTLAMPASWGGCSCGGLEATAGDVLNVAAIELRAHGHQESSVTMAERAADWFRGHPIEKEYTRFGLGVSEYYAERSDRAREIFTRLAAGNPEDLSSRGFVGTLAVRQGDRGAAIAIDEDLQRIHRAYLFGEASYQRARIASVLGDRARAVLLLRQAIAEGFTQRDPHGYRFVLRHERDFEFLAGYAPYEQLVAVKD